MECNPCIIYIVGPQVQLQRRQQRLRQHWLLVDDIWHCRISTVLSLSKVHTYIRKFPRYKYTQFQYKLANEFTELSSLEIKVDICLSHFRIQDSRLTRYFQQAENRQAGMEGWTADRQSALSNPVKLDLTFYSLHNNRIINYLITSWAFLLTTCSTFI